MAALLSLIIPTAIIFIAILAWLRPASFRRLVPYFVVLINATLRRESGAAISPSEFSSARMQYFPQPGDTPEVIAQKRMNRLTVMKGLSREAGPNYTPPSMYDPQATNVPKGPPAPAAPPPPPGLAAQAGMNVGPNARFKTPNNPEGIPPTQENVQALKQMANDPQAVQVFDEHLGRGAAEWFLGGGR